MSFELPALADSKQRMQQARIPNVNFRRFDQPLTNISVPRFEHAHDKRAGQCVEMALYSGMSLSQRSPNLRAVPDTARVMRGHGPESAHRSRRHLHAELSQVTFEERANKIFAPGRARSFRAVQIDGIFQIEVSALRPLYQLPCESSLAALTGPQQRHGRTCLWA